MRIHLIAAVALATTVACGAATTQPAATQARSATTAPSATPKPLTATAEVKDKDGTIVGTATLTEQSAGVRIVLTASKLPAGQHGWHIHAVGKCEPPDFASAGGHFNPEGKQHGAQNPQGAHAGDLGNLSVGADGAARADVVAKVTLVSGASSLVDADGSAIVVHSGADDEKTDPAGNSGARIACGVVRAS